MKLVIEIGLLLGFISNSIRFYKYYKKTKTKNIVSFIQKSINLDKNAIKCIICLGWVLIFLVALILEFNNTF